VEEQEEQLEKWNDSRKIPERWMASYIPGLLLAHKNQKGRQSTKQA